MSSVQTDLVNSFKVDAANQRITRSKPKRSEKRDVSEHLNSISNRNHVTKFIASQSVNDPTAEKKPDSIMTLVQTDLVNSSHNIGEP